MKIQLNTRINNIVIFVLGLLAFLMPISTSGQLSESAEISLITCRPGDEIYNTFGHTAIRVKDPARDIDILYNYGMFSFSEPGFVMKFLRGKLQYWLGVERYLDFSNNYSTQKRSVIEQRLELSANQKQVLISALSKNMKPENRKYLYDFFFDNCSTRPRDIFADQLALNLENVPSEKTFRELLDEYLNAKPWLDFGIDLVVGSIADRKASPEDQMFLPEYLMYNMDAATLKGKSLVYEKRMLVDYEKEAEQRNKKAFPFPVLIAGLLFLLELLLFTGIIKLSVNMLECIDKLTFLLFAIGGFLILFMWFGTDHIPTKMNMNILWLNPLFLFPVFSKSGRKINILILSLLVLLVLQQAFFQYIHPASNLLVLFIFLKLLRNTDKIPFRKTA